ncbi:hypothetical protein SAMN02910339_02010 [Lachnospiraceae bacterium YSD2013]|nr:hypothetical protein SAMN02910339_02010 [Lachnospiraceae bacterium YSD2013]
MKNIKRFAAAFIIAAIAFLSAGSSARAEGEPNTYEKTFTYTRNDGKTFGATVTIKSSAETDWNLRFEKENDEATDNYVYYRIIADGNPGDVIDVSLTTEYPDTLLGVTMMPRINGSWKSGTQKTLFATADDNSINLSYTIDQNASDLQVAASAYSKSFSSKKPGSMDVILTIETPLHTDTVKSEGGGRFFITVVISVLFLVALSMFMGKRSAMKNKKK